MTPPVQVALISCEEPPQLYNGIARTLWLTTAHVAVFVEPEPAARVADFAGVLPTRQSGRDLADEAHIGNESFVLP